MTKLFTTRRTLVAALSSILLLAGCSGKHETPEVRNDEGTAANPPLSSSLKVSDANAKQQLVKGFSALESGSWRWTNGNFSALLKTPPGAAQKGATLTLALVISEAVLKQVHSQSLTASIGGKELKTEKYLDPGGHTFSADVPAAMLSGDTVSVDFSLDNSLPPSPSDRRELGLIATAVGLETN